MSVALDSTRTIDIDMFVPADSIAWIWYDKPHYLTPDDPVGEEAFAVIRDAMAATNTVGIARLVLYRRERAVMLVPRDKGIVLWTLHYGDEVREAPSSRRAAMRRPNPRPSRLITSLIKERTRDWDPAILVDPVQKELKSIIAAKQKGKRPPKAERRAGRAEQRRQHHGRAPQQPGGGEEARAGEVGRSHRLWVRPPCPPCAAAAPAFCRQGVRRRPCHRSAPSLAWACSPHRPPWHSRGAPP